MTDKVATPADFVPMFAIATGAEGDVAIPVSPLNPLPISGGSSGSKDALNSTTAELGSGATFTGDWVENNDPHIAWSLFADQDGSFYVDISPDDGTTIAFSKYYDIVGGETGRFDAFVKGSRSHRVRFVNGATAQTNFVLSTFTGQGLYPFARSDRDDPVGVAIGVAGITSTEWRCYVDLDNRTDWPHADIGYIQIHSANFFYDKSSNCRGAIRLGVITRVDGTNADVAVVLGTSFDNSDLTKDNRDRELNSPIKLKQSGGELTKYFTSSKLTNVAVINTGTPLDSGKAGVTVTPAVGDVVVQFEVTAGTLSSGFVSGAYSGSAEAP